MSISPNHRESILDKLKPSLKNKMITKKLGSILGNNIYDVNNENFENIENDFYLLKANNSEKNNDAVIKNNSINNQNASLDKNAINFNYINNDNNNDNNKNVNNYYLNPNNINGYVNNIILNNSIQNSQNQNKRNDNFPISNNNLKFDKMIEVVITENSFLRQESHSILPFLFLNSKEIHRMCLSDYEIKLVNKSIKNKIKNNRLDWIDYYKKGLIKFYQAKYFESYLNFKAAHNMHNKDKEVSKWLAFNTLIIIFCTNREPNENSKVNFNDITSSPIKFNSGKKGFEKNGFSNINNGNMIPLSFFGSFKIDFSRMEKFIIKNEDSDYSRSTNINENVSDEEENHLFSCCNARKTKTKSVTVSSIVNNYKVEKNDFKFNKSQLCKDLENILNEILERTFNLKLNENNNDFLTKENNYLIEIWWMSMIISIYVKLNPEQKNFSNFFDPKHYVKKIKDKDVYLGYLAYAEFNCLMNKTFNPENIFVEIIYKFPKRIEGYLKLWNRLVKGNPKEYKKAHSLSEVFWKNSSIIQFDNDVY